MQKVIKRGLCLALSVVMVLMMFTALPSAALAEDDTDAIDIESPEGTGIDNEALDATEVDDADSDASDVAEDDAIEDELVPLDASITETESDASDTEAEGPGDLVPMATGAVTIYLDRLGEYDTNNSGAVSTMSQWNYSNGNKELRLTTPNGNYTLLGVNTSLRIDASSATNASITLLYTTITPPSGHTAFDAQGSKIILSGTNTMNGTLNVDGNCTIKGDGSLTVTGGTGVSGCHLAFNTTTSLSITEYAAVTFRGNGNRAIYGPSGAPAIQISDTAKLTMVNSSTAAETHTFTALNATSTYRWKVTGGTITAGGATSVDITVSVAAGATATVERQAPGPMTVSITYQTHVQNVGWQPLVNGGQVSGTTGQGLRLEGLIINMTNNTGLIGAITYSTHVQNIGWQTPVIVATTGESLTEAKGGISGTTGQGLRLEAVKINLIGALGDGYDVYYRVHAQNVGWMGWAKNGAPAGTAGYSLRLEAIQIVLVLKGQAAPADTYNGIPRTAGAPAMIDPSVVSSSIPYNATVHVQNIGDRTYSSATGATILGTTGSSLRVEAIKLSFPSPTISINYRVHIQNIGWQDWKTNGQMAGTSGQSLRLEALAINLSGTNSSNYDVYYRTHIQNIGWTGWAKNGQQCGSAGYGYRMEAMQIVIMQKSLNTAPGLNANYFYQR